MADTINASSFKTLQGAINYAALNNKKLIINDGVYRVESIAFPNNVKIEGMGNVIIRATKLTNYFARITGNNVYLTNITIDGNNLVTKGLTLGIAVKNIHLTRVKVINIYSNRIQARGIFIQEACEDIYLYDCLVNNVYCVPSGEQTDDPGSSRGISIASVNGADATCPKNIFIKATKVSNVEPVEDGDGIHALFRTGHMNLVIENCEITNCAKRAIKLQCNGAKVLTNTFRFTKQTTSAFQSLHQVVGVYGNDITVEGNKAYLTNALSFIDFSNSISSINKNILIKNNEVNIENFRGAYGAIASTVQLENFEISENKITVNRVTGTDSNIAFVYLRKYAKNFNIHDNVFTGPMKKGITIHSYGIVEISDGTIANNKFSGVAGRLINIYTHPNINNLTVYNNTNI